MRSSNTVKKKKKKKGEGEKKYLCHSVKLKFPEEMSGDAHSRSHNPEDPRAQHIMDLPPQSIALPCIAFLTLPQTFCQVEQSDEADMPKEGLIRVAAGF